eukprot:Amastigsp_a175245_65.p4 type:complete len:190 gc:universal Amastigsp_a175245_65:1044-1613(+)
MRVCDHELLPFCVEARKCHPHGLLREFSFSIDACCLFCDTLKLALDLVAELFKLGARQTPLLLAELFEQLEVREADALLAELGGSVLCGRMPGVFMGCGLGHRDRVARIVERRERAPLTHAHKLGVHCRALCRVKRICRGKRLSLGCLPARGLFADHLGNEFAHSGRVVLVIDVRERVQPRRVHERGPR